MADYKVRSADSHAEEPQSLYDRLPAEYRHRTPHVEVINGGNYLIVEGQRPISVDPPNPLMEEDQRKDVGMRMKVADDKVEVTDRDLGIDIEARLSDIAEDGVSAEVIYPNGIFFPASSPDPEFQMILGSLYNDFFAEVFGDKPETFVVSAVIPVADIAAAVDEVKRVAGMGYRSLSVPTSVAKLPYNLPDYNPLWAAVEETGIALSFHVFTPTGPKDEAERNTAKVNLQGEDLFGMVLGMAEAMSPLSMLTAAGVLERHPDLKIVLVECGTGWLAWLLYAMDDVVKRRHMWQQPRLSMLPSEYFKRQGYITFSDDPVGLMTRSLTGVDGLMWGSDYPHEEGTFPHSREVIEEIFRDMPEDEKRKIVGENAARLYGFIN
ncbi:MAG: amidohydrolase family protein [Dehalococcoidia bacterium]